MRAYALALLVSVTFAAAAGAEEKKPDPKEGTGDDLDLELDIEDLAPAKPPPDLGGLLELDLDPAPQTAVPPPSPPAEKEEPLPPPPVPEPAPLPVVTVKRVVPLPADPAPPPPPPVPKAPVSFGIALQTVGGGMSAETPRGLAVGDAGSFSLGGAAFVRWESWEASVLLRRVYQDRWLAANVRADNATEGGLRAGAWFLRPHPSFSAGVSAGLRYRFHWSDADAWWSDRRSVAPSEWRVEAVPAAAWQFYPNAALVMAVPVGYGTGSVDQRDWRRFAGFATPG